MKPQYRTTHLEGKTRAPPPLPEFQNNQLLVGHSRFRSGKQALLCEPGCSPGEALGWHLQEDFPVSTNQPLVTQHLPEPKPPCNVNSLFFFFFWLWLWAFSFITKPVFCFRFPFPVQMRRLWYWNPWYIQVTTSRTCSSDLIYYITLEFWQPQYKTWPRPFYYHIVGKLSGKSILVNPVSGKTKKKSAFQWNPRRNIRSSQN